MKNCNFYHPVQKYTSQIIDTLTRLSSAQHSEYSEALLEQLNTLYRQRHNALLLQSLIKQKAA